MCGIAGYYNFGNDGTSRPDVIREMTSTLAHRGPDEEACWAKDGVGFGIRRLRVVDPEGGHQPMPNEDGTVRVIFNGEIYNHSQLRTELSGLGHRFQSRSDTEVIVHAYEEWGAACVDRFNGMFAFAVWDDPQKRLFLARDRLGIKPLFVHESPSGVVFGSELKAVLTAPWVPFEWDLEAIDSFLTYEYVPAPQTIVAGIKKFPTATTAAYSADGRKQTRRYWRLEAGSESADARVAASRLRELLADSVGLRLLADVPVGLFLSGGLDSTTLAALASRASAAPVETFTIGFEDASYDEREYARIAARHFGTHHFERTVEPAVVELAERLAWSLDEPFADVSTFPTYLVSAHARESVTVALSGDGGDELFAGYDQYRADQWASRLRRATAGRPWQVVDALLERIPPTEKKKGAVNFAKRFVEGLRYPADLEHARWWIFTGPRERQALLSRSLRERLSDHDPLEHYRSRLREGEAAGFRGLQRQLYADITGYLPDDILTKVDRMSMAVSLEARVPFLDHRVVEHAMTIPGEWKLRRGESKWILKRALGELLPPTILNRRKQGFSMPMKNWLRGPLEPLLREMTTPDRVRERGWFEGAEVERLRSEHLAGVANHAHRLWCLISLELSLAHLTRLVAERPRMDGGVPA